MNTKKIVPALFFVVLSLAAKPADTGNNEVIEKVKNHLALPGELFENKTENAVRLSFKINAEGKAEEVIINAENEKVKTYVTENLKKLNFSKKSKTINLLMRFKLQ